MSYAAALDLIEQLRALFAADPDQSRPLVTLDPSEAAQQLAAGGSCIMIGPPASTFPTYHQAEHEWTLAAVSGPLTDRAASWQRLDGIVARLLAEQLDVTRVDPGSFTAERAVADYSALLITITTEATI